MATVARHPTREIPMPRPVHLEPEAQAFVEKTANPPFLFDLGPEKGRKAVDEVQSAPIDKPDADTRDATVAAGKWGDVPVRIVRPKGSTGPLPVILYVHGAGWVFGNAHTHDRLVRVLAARSNAAVVFPEYSLSPETKYPTAIEQCYAVARGSRPARGAATWTGRGWPWPGTAWAATWPRPSP
jgi:acetyl esterase